MLVDYSKPNVLTLPIVSKEGAVERSVLLSPGINEVAGKDWKQLATLPKVVRLIESGEIKVALDAEDTQENFALSKASIAEATSIIKKTWNLVLLEDWKAGESRTGVIKEISKQIAHVEEKTKPKQAANG